jgi:SAM-dependent methyltransferase
MKDSVYQAEATLEAYHWWFVGRRRLFSRIIKSLKLDHKCKVLDIGTSTGTNLRMLNNLQFTNVFGLDKNPLAISFCKKKGLKNVELGDVSALPYADNSFELILATDILEHIEDDQRAVGEIKRVLNPGGWALFTAPAFRTLWGPQDDLSNHLRRYSKKELIQKIGDSGLIVKQEFYFNYLLFLPILAARRLLKLFKIELRSENDVNSPMINKILTSVFEMDINMAPRLRPPFGVSILTLAQKRP